MSETPYLYTDPQALLAAVGADRAAFSLLATMYLDGTAAAAQRWNAACTPGDSAALGALCHELRGSAVLLGAASLGQHLAACETPARAGAMPAPALLAAATTALAQVRCEIMRALAELGSNDDQPA